MTALLEQFCDPSTQDDGTLWILLGRISGKTMSATDKNPHWGCASKICFSNILADLNPMPPPESSVVGFHTTVLWKTQDLSHLSREQTAIMYPGDITGGEKYYRPPQT